MSHRDAARHRSPQRARTPLTDVTDALSGRVVVARRSGAVLAVSTGLIASIGLPARAAGAAPAAASTLTAVTAVNPVAASGAARLAAPGLVLDGTLSAPSMATVSFDSSVFAPTLEKTVPRPVTVSPVTTERRTPAASRSTERKALKARKKSSTSSSSASSSSASGGSVMSIAARYVGTPYSYGGTTPSGFDCSGYTSYVYRQLGVSLPRTADAQMSATTRISASQAKPGDLVFFVEGDHAYHVGIYAGDGELYDAPRAGKSVSKRSIWDATIVFGRV